MQYCRGTYHRDDAGVWRYAWNDPVPGARDLTLAELLPFSGASAGSASSVHGPQDLVIGMLAPELDIDLMLTVRQVAEPLWARPVVERWVARRRQGVGIAPSPGRSRARPAGSGPDRTLRARPH